ncbi:hypothetical protein U9M48_037596 [Paspalum notatum var. saurae]|uniref:Uncharacterized protein n=1 Tax=Paspalum notatum var. saurae TaxID=547442 RepID=A0AAQ3UGB1_PASNO
MGWPTRVGGDLLSSLSYVLRRRCLSSPSRIREGPSAFALPSSGLPVLPAGALPPKDTVADLVSRFGHREIAVGTHQSQSRLLQLKDLVSYEEITGSIFHCNSMPLHEMCKTGALQDANLKGNNKAKDGLITDGTVDPWNPPYAPSPQFNDCEHAKEWLFKATDFVANSRETNIIILDRTPQWVRDGLWRRVPELVSILEEDDVQRFLRFFSNNRRCMAWGFIITPETFNYIVSENALKCAKVTLEGKASELSGNRASPNYMNPYGYFPLHEAAERFSVDMVKLLFEYGASTNDHLHYIYKLIQLLCLPKMKIFLDTTRLLARKTNNLLDELWNYVEDGKLIQTAVLLLAAQESIRVGSSSRKRQGICKPDGFETIMARMMKHLVDQKWGIGESRKAQNNLEASSVLECTALLVDLISRAGEALDAYIQTHSEIPPFCCLLNMPTAKLLDQDMC